MSAVTLCDQVACDPGRAVPNRPQIIQPLDVQIARAVTPGSQLTQDQVADVIWGPYRFNPGQRGTSQNGRAHGPFSLPAHEPYPVSLEQSIPPSWTGPSWRAQYEDKPVRLEITCRREGHAPWTLCYEIDAKPDPAGQVM